MPIQVPVIVLSDARTMFKNTIHVPVNANATLATELEVARTKLAELAEDAETLLQLRRFFIAMGLHSEHTLKDFEIPAPVSEHA